MQGEPLDTGKERLKVHRTKIQATGFTAGHWDLWLSPVFRDYPGSPGQGGLSVTCAGLSEKTGPEMVGPSPSVTGDHET